MFQHVLVALDQSAYSRAALPTAIEMAKKFGASLYVLHVAEHDHGRAVVFSMESPAEATKLVAEAVKTAARRASRRRERCSTSPSATLRKPLSRSPSTTRSI